jgi:hypothetical protein
MMTTPERAAEDAQAERIAALLSQLDRIPDRPDAFNPLEWDDHGLPPSYKGNDFEHTDVVSALRQTQ